jgi:hypothetical protein
MVCKTTSIKTTAEELAYGIPCLMRCYLFLLLFITSLLCILGAAEDKLCFKRVGKFNQVHSGYLLWYIADHLSWISSVLTSEETAISLVGFLKKSLEAGLCVWLR